MAWRVGLCRASPFIEYGQQKETDGKVCSFCGRSEHDVKLLITGLTGYICEDCAAQAYEIVKSTGVLNVEHKKQGLKFKPKKYRSHLR